YSRLLVEEVAGDQSSVGGDGGKLRRFIDDLHGFAAVNRDFPGNESVGAERVINHPFPIGRTVRAERAEACRQLLQVAAINIYSPTLLSASTDGIKNDVAIVRHHGQIAFIRGIIR